MLFNIVSKKLKALCPANENTREETLNERIVRNLRKTKRDRSRGWKFARSPTGRGFSKNCHRKSTRKVSARTHALARVYACASTRYQYPRESPLYFPPLHHCRRRFTVVQRRPVYRNDDPPLGFSSVFPSREFFTDGSRKDSPFFSFAHSRRANELL